MEGWQAARLRRLTMIALTVSLTVGLGLTLAADPVRADNYPDTCLDADPIDPGTHFGDVGYPDRDVLRLETTTDDRQYIELQYSNGGTDSALVIFGVNEFAMRSDRGGNTGYFEVDEGKDPSLYYDHRQDVSLSLSDGDEAVYRKPDAGDELHARHIVHAYQLPEGDTEFTIETHTDDPICLVLKPSDPAGSGSWMLSYSTTQAASEDAQETPSERELLRRALNAKLDQIETLEHRIDELENQSANTTAVKTVIRTRTVYQTVTVENGETPRQASGGLGMSGIAVGMVVLVLGIILGSRIG